MNMNISTSSSQLPLPIYIINLNRDKERYENIMKQLKLNTNTNTNTKITRIEAVNGQQLTPKKYTGRLTKNQAGCYYSHMKALEQMIDDNVPYAIILEDDVTLTKLFSYLPQYILTLPKDLDVCWIGNSRGKWPRDPCSPYPIPSYDQEDDMIQVNNFLWKLPTIPTKDNHPVGGYGLLCTRKGAMMMLSVARENHLHDPIDMVYVKHPELEKYMTIPSIVTHCYDFGSNITNENTNEIENNEMVNKLLTNKTIVVCYLISLILISIIIYSFC